MQIVQQVRDKEFTKEIESQTKAAVQLAEAVKDKALADLQSQLDAAEQAGKENEQGIRALYQLLLDQSRRRQISDGCPQDAP